MGLGFGRPSASQRRPSASYASRSDSAMSSIWPLTSPAGKFVPITTSERRDSRDSLATRFFGRHAGPVVVSEQWTRLSSTGSRADQGELCNS